MSRARRSTRPTGFGRSIVFSTTTRAALPLALQFVLYCLIGGTAALANLGLFGLMHAVGVPLAISIPTAFGIAAILNYGLCMSLLFDRNARWSNFVEWSFYALLVGVMGTIDYAITRWLIDTEFTPIAAKTLATILLPVLNFAGRRFLIFPSPRRRPWGPRPEP